jgi:hypothetical protein
MQKTVSVKYGGITINLPANIDKVRSISPDEIKKLNIAFDCYRKLGDQDPVYGKDHWKNPFIAVVPAKDKDILCRAINYYLADNPAVEKLTSQYYLVRSGGYQA